MFTSSFLQGTYASFVLLGSLILALVVVGTFLFLVFAFIISLGRFAIWVFLTNPDDES